MLTVALGSTLLIAAAVMIAIHLRDWRSADHGGLGEVEQDFHARRFRRRLQASIMLGVIGLLVLGDLWLDRVFHEDLVRLLYWSGVMLLLVWLLLLAAGDWLASRTHFRGQLNRLQAERSVLQADLDRLRREQRERNEPKSSPPEQS